jgi:hypothetical protein
VAFCHNLLFRSINCDTKQDEKDGDRGAGRRRRHEDDQEHEKDGTGDSPHPDKTSESESHLLLPRRERQSIHEKVFAVKNLHGVPEA